MTFARVRAFVLAFPGMTEGTSYGQPSFLLKGKFFSRFNQKEAGLVVLVEPDLRDLLLAAEPETFFTTEHYRGYPALLVRLPKVKPAVLRDLYERAFRAKAGKKLLAQFEGRS